MREPVPVRSEMVQTQRLRTHVLVAGPDDGTPVLLLHGNLSTSAFFDQILARLPEGVHGIAPDLRGFGGTEPVPIDATRGVHDLADDVAALVDTLELVTGGRQLHLIGWSVGAAVAMQYAMDRPAGGASLLLESPVSPYGIGGTRDISGTPTAPDWAGTGAGTTSAEYVERLSSGDRSSDSPMSPRNILKLYFRPPFQVDPEREERYLDAVLTTRTGADFFPGDSTAAAGWPGFAPGTRGIMNAISGKYLNLSAFASITPRPPVIWVRGADDQTVADQSVVDVAYLGQIGIAPGWPGADAFPPQPMIGQLRALFDLYVANGGQVREVVFHECGHSPHVERESDFLALLAENLGAPAPTP